jgi:cation:H+ antiporter
LAALPRAHQFLLIGALAIVAGAIILLEAEPFAESMIGAAKALGVNQFLLVQWVSPLAGELPEVVIMVLFTLSLRPGYALGALISDKINQWTLLVGALPLIFSLGAGAMQALPLGPRQHEEFFLTAAQSVFAVALLLRLRFGLASALVLLTLFLAQVGIAFIYQADEPRTIALLSAFAWAYLGMAAILFLTQMRYVAAYAQVVLGRNPAKPA